MVAFLRLLILPLCCAACLLRPASAGMDVIAHRGAMMLAPENTLASQRLAYEMGAEYVECDVRLSGDNVPVILHDWGVDRTSNGRGGIGGMTLADVKKLDAGSWFSPAFAGEKIPTLAEMIEVAKQYNRKLMLDIKGDFISSQVVEVIRQSGIPLNQIAFLTWGEFMTSGYTSRLPGVKMLRPVTLPSGESLRAENVTRAQLDDLRRQKVTTLIFMVGYVYKADIDRFHDAGFEVSSLYNAYTAPFYYQDIGLDSFWTDYIDVTLNGLSRTEQQWNNWSDGVGLNPDQRGTWMDPDGDNMNNLVEFALNTNPLIPNAFPLAAPTPPGKVGWTIDLRDDWSQFLTVGVQNSWTGPWWDLPNSVDILSPTRVQFLRPAGPGKQFFRLRFDLIR